MSFKDGYPSDSFAVHKASPFSLVPESMADSKPEVMFVPQAGAYLNSVHQDRLARFYRLLLLRHKCQLSGITVDHDIGWKVIEKLKDFLDQISEGADAILGAAYIVTIYIAVWYIL